MTSWLTGAGLTPYKPFMGAAGESVARVTLSTFMNLLLEYTQLVVESAEVVFTTVVGKLTTAVV